MDEFSRNEMESVRKHIFPNSMLGLCALFTRNKKTKKTKQQKIEKKTEIENAKTKICARHTVKCNTDWMHLL